VSSEQNINPVALLREMESACRFAADGLPAKAEPRQMWSGIAFRLGGRQLLVPMGEVIETLTMPQLSMVPNTAEWVYGIANVRGRLLPVFDLLGVLEDMTLAPGSRSRVMVIEFGDIYAGLVVDEVLGLRHYPVDARIPAGDLVDSVLAPYVKDGFADDGVFHGIFRIPALAESARFLKAAV